jgi:hypothetical protein
MPLRTLRKNLYNTLFVIDPSDPELIFLFHRLYMFLDRFAPFKMGVLLVTPQFPNGASEEDAKRLTFSQEFAAIYHFFAKKEPSLAALFGLYVVQNYHQTGLMTSSTLLTSFSATSSKAKISVTYDIVVDPNSDNFKAAVRGNEFAIEKGFQAGSIFLNGEYIKYTPVCS